MVKNDAAETDIPYLYPSMGQAQTKTTIPTTQVHVSLHTACLLHPNIFQTLHPQIVIQVFCYDLKAPKSVILSDSTKPTQSHRRHSRPVFISSISHDKQTDLHV